MDANLVVFKPDGSRMDIPLSKGSYRVGRGKECRLRVPLPSVSRKHCELHVSESELRVSDLGSSNGTFRNGLRLTPGDDVPLQAGDVLSVGAFQMTLQLDGEPSKVSPPGPSPVSAAPRSKASEPAPASSAAQDASQSRPAETAAAQPTAGPSPLGDLDDDDDDLEDLDETISRVGPPGLLGNSDSSAFDIDLDLDDLDDNPKL